MDQRIPPQASHAQGIEIGAVTTGITSFKALLSQKATPRKRTGARSVISKRTKIEPVARVQFEGESEEVKEEARKTETSINEPIDPAYLSRLSSAQQSIATTDLHSPLVITGKTGNKLAEVVFSISLISHSASLSWVRENCNARWASDSSIAKWTAAIEYTHYFLFTKSLRRNPGSIASKCQGPSETETAA